MSTSRWRLIVLQARRLGRGIGSSKGKTAGRGHKGQKARTGRHMCQRLAPRGSSTQCSGISYDAGNCKGNV